MTIIASAKPVNFVMTVDAARSRPYYTEMLGLALGQQDDFATVYDPAGTILRVTEVPDFGADPHPVLGWSVADMTAAVTKLAARGVVFTVHDGFGQDALGIWTAPDGGAKVAWFNDPDGKVLSMTKPAL